MQNAECRMRSLTRSFTGPHPGAARCQCLPQEKAHRAATPERRLRIEEPAGIAAFFIFFRQIAYRGLGTARRL
jgi:hypothetical protein